MGSDWQGREDGRRDSEADAESHQAKRPRPRFVRSLLSDQYQQAYVSSYHRTYEIWLRWCEAEIARGMTRQRKLLPNTGESCDQMFERGWRDGYSGKENPPKGCSYDEMNTYERGYCNGCQSREWDLANRLRQQGRGR